MELIKIHCAECNNFRKIVDPRILYIVNKILVLSIICNKCDRKFKEEGIEIKFLV